MTFHTFEAGTYLTGNQFRVINNKLKEFDSKYFNDPKSLNRKIFTGLCGRGIVIYLYKRDTDDSKFIYHVVYRINPTRMINGDDYINLYHSNEAYKIFELTNEILLSVSPQLPPLNICTLTRFDFCSNIICEEPKMVPDFIELINRSYVPDKYYKQKKIHNSRTGRWDIPKEEAIFTRPDYVEVAFYNKIHQMETEHLHIDWNSNVLRCEIRCCKMYIDTLKRKFGITSIEEFFNELPSIGTYVFTYQLKKLNLSGSYYRLNEIISIIENTQLKRKTKKRMTNFSKYAARHKGIENAIISELIRDTTKKVKKFKKLAICAMPLPYRSAIPSEVNLLDLCLKYADAKAVENCNSDRNR